MTTLGAALAGFTAVPSYGADVESTEATSLLPPEADSSSDPANVARFAGLLGFSAGLGALLAGDGHTLYITKHLLTLDPRAVFGFLRLPPILAPHLDESLSRAILLTFYIIVALALSEAVFLVWGLKRRPFETASPPQNETAVEREMVGWKDSAVGIAKELGRGFIIAQGEGEVALACLSGFAVRLPCSVALRVLSPPPSDSSSSDHCVGLYSSPHQQRTLNYPAQKLV